MKFSLCAVYDAPVHYVAQTLLSRELADARAQLLHVKQYSFTPVTTHGGTNSICYNAHIPAHVLPHSVGNFARNGLSISITMTYKADPSPCAHESLENPQELSSCRKESQEKPDRSTIGGIITATFTMKEAPVRGELTIHLTPAQPDQDNESFGQEKHNSTHAAITGSYSVSLPFIGAAIEKKIRAYLDGILATDCTLTNRILAEKYSSQ